MRYFMRLSYRGAGFHGWQIQPNDNSVQETIEQAMATVLRHPVSITGAGRTDTGVNARMMVAHFDVDTPIADTALLVRSLNGIVGRDIAIHTIFPVHDEAHARFDATSRTYKYFAHTLKSPFLYPLSWQCRPDMDFDLMNQAAAHLLEYRDFTSFSKLHTDVKTNNCVVTRAQWDRVGEQWVFTITADRFLRNMVRAVVGTLVEVGLHRITIDDFCRIIEQRDRCKAGTSMPPHPLFLWDITYPYTIL
ncbi:MAG: tRNA pseudouridine(38-40) synthase TruA [Muribaculaceae bacterium]|nr:tRNA pseudouridine(38-40) synthase TruA [Muribaculaceae bacterium]